MVTKISSKKIEHPKFYKYIEFIKFKMLGTYWMELSNKKKKQFSMGKAFFPKLHLSQAEDFEISYNSKV